MTMQNSTTITVLGVKISCLSRKNALNAVSDWLLADSRRSYFIVTPNPEMLVLAQSDALFKHILNSADLAIPDGAGLVIASKLQNLTNNLQLITNNKNIYVSSHKSSVISSRVSGIDLMLDLCQMAAKNDHTVGLLGAQPGVAQKTAEVLKKKYPGLKIKFAVSEISDLKKIDPSASLRVNSSRSLRVDLLFVAYGAPKQEKLIAKLISNHQLTMTNHQSPINNDQNPKAKIYMSVGGAFDLISGRVKRAPLFIQKIGLEWLFRLCQESWRIKRIWTAVAVFPCLVFKSLKSPK